MRKWLIEIRNAKKLSQYDVARAANLSQSYYAGIESGVRGRPLKVSVAQRIADVLDFDWVMFYEKTTQGE